MLSERIDETKRIVEAIMRNYKRPIIYSGFGKDSICLVHLCNRDMKLGLPIMFLRDAQFPLKYRFANKVIEEWNLTCWNYPPYTTSVFYYNGVFEVVRHFKALAGDLLLCALLYRPAQFVEGEYLCALKDIYEMPFGVMAFPWDIGLQGHRYTETKPHSGGIPARIKWVAKHFLGGCDWAQPLREWSAEEIYEYHIKNDIPINHDVYDIVADTFVPKSDPTYNPDRRPACFDCMLPGESPAVICPKLGCLTNRLWSELRKVTMPNDWPRPYGLSGGKENG